MAGSATVQNTTTNFILNMIFNPEENKKLINVIDTFMDKVKDNVMDKMTVE